MADSYDLIAIGAGPTNPGFPEGAIYLSEAGGDSRVPNTAGISTVTVSGNTFTNNWSGVVLWENAILVFRQEYDAAGTQAGQTSVDPAAFFGQDTQALDRISTEFARTIVSSILEAF